MAKKGHTNNPNGRPKGIPNKTTVELRQTIQLFIENNIETLQVEFDKLEPKEKFQAVEKLLPYILPRKQAFNVEPENKFLVAPKIIVKRV